MAPAKKRTPQVEEVRPYVEGVATNPIDKLCGPDGPVWGTKLTEIEDLFLAIGEVLSAKMLADALARPAAAQAKGPALSRTCPGCQQPLVGADTHERIVPTKAGDAEGAEPEGLTASIPSRAAGGRRWSISTRRKSKECSLALPRRWTFRITGSRSAVEMVGANYRPSPTATEVLRQL